MADHPCEDTRPYVCYRSEDQKATVNECGTVDPEYRLDVKTGSCYKFHIVPRNFSRAFLACSAEGSHLAIINSDQEAEVLKNLFAKYPAAKMVGNFWKDVAFIGAHNWGEPADWRTIHGETLSEAGYDNFRKGEPNNSPPGEYCLSIYRDAKLNDLWCDREAAFICEKSPDYPPVCEEEDLV
ncbi:hypothetical protein PYW07_009906 [Mythimna separata]|uniref:C-type lectin domain-containing protein n=1 Tax=Mythimna separata TaxID=271217 RepID=A0AAD7YI39_MYTSE|nr:hypothetical protein PYW07_009906 [Mythimna separata]